MSSIKKWRYVSYWHTWRRWLGENDGLIYEIELTPSNPTHSGSWENMGMRIFAHGTPPSGKDRVCRYLPPHVTDTMKAHLPDYTVDMLLHHDFFSNIDFEKFKRLQNGGAEYKNCLKQSSPDEMVVSLPGVFNRFKTSKALGLDYKG